MIAATGIEELLFDLANALRIPVLILALAALAFMLVDLGAFLVELSRRGRRHRQEQVGLASTQAREALRDDDATAARRRSRTSTSARCASSNAAGCSCASVRRSA